MNTLESEILACLELKPSTAKQIAQYLTLKKKVPVRKGTINPILYKLQKQNKTIKICELNKPPFWHLKIESGVSIIPPNLSSNSFPFPPPPPIHVSPKKGSTPKTIAKEELKIRSDEFTPNPKIYLLVDLGNTAFYQEITKLQANFSHIVFFEDYAFNRPKCLVQLLQQFPHWKVVSATEGHRNAADLELIWYVFEQIQFCRQSKQEAIFWIVTRDFGFNYLKNIGQRQGFKIEFICKADELDRVKAFQQF